MKFSPIAKITSNEAVILETAVSDGAVRCGKHATLANVWLRDVVFRLQRAGTLRRVETDASVLMQWELTETGRIALDEFRSRRQRPRQQAPRQTFDVA